MKKLISAFVMMFLCSLSYAESMKFITVLSSPVGTFNKLEAVDSTASAYGKTVNFCTSIGTQGVVELKGTKTAELTTVSLSKNTTLGKTDEGKFSLNNITLKQGGSIKGGRLFGNTVTVNNAASGKADNLYGNQLTVAGAKTKTLDIGSGKSKINGPGDSTGKEDMVWSNEYQDDDACKSGSACAKQYLLKEKNTCDSSGSGACTSSGGTWDNGLCGCVCPSNMVLQDGKCLGGFKPEIIDVGVLVDCHYCPGGFDGRKQCGTAGADPTHCYYGNDFDSTHGCSHVCDGGSLGVNSYTFYLGGSLVKSPKSDTADERWLWWSGGTVIGGQMYRYSGGSMPNCYGSDYQSLCDRNCTPGASSCTYKCLISKTDSGCSNGTYKYSGGCGRSPNNASGTGKVMRCVKDM